MKLELKLYLTWWLLMSMNDYSASIPSGTTPGKVWRRREPYQCADEAPEAKHYVGMYGEHEGNKVPMYWFEVVIIEGPERPGLESCDWSNFKRWQADREQERADAASARPDIHEREPATEAATQRAPADQARGGASLQPGRVARGGEALRRFGQACEERGVEQLRRLAGEVRSRYSAFARMV